MTLAPTSEKLPPLCRQFNLPDAFDRIDLIDVRSVLDRASANFRSARDNYLRVHGDFYGRSRNHACTYSQKTHDQIQGQISSLYNELVMTQAVLYAFLELAFERIGQLECGGMHYRGVWRDSEEYPKGSVVSHQGGCWHANKLTSARPGTDPDGWTLMVRRGRDGKDAR